MEHGLRQVEVFVKGPGSGREAAIRALQSSGLIVLSISDVDAGAAQRLPAAEAASRLGRLEDRMARYTGPVCRLCRRYGEKLLLKGDKCFTKCTLDKRPTPPGEQKSGRRRKLSDRGLQLREKQKARYSYGVLEKQFVDYYEDAVRLPGVTGENLVRLLELRLDNIVHRLGFADSRKQARQLVRHGHIMLNGRKTDIPSAATQGRRRHRLDRHEQEERVLQDRQGEHVQQEHPPAGSTSTREQMTGRVVIAAGAAARAPASSTRPSSSSTTRGNDH